MTKGKVVLLVEPSGSEMLFALVCFLLGISVYSTPPYMTAGCCLHATPGCTLFSSKSAPVRREVWFTGLTLGSLARQRAHPYEVRIA